MALVMSWGAGLTRAAAGDLDQSFGDGGIATIEMDPNDTRGRSIAVREDGKIITAGHVGDETFVTRHNPDGSLDGGFNTLITDMIRGGNAVALDDTERILVAGSGNDHLMRLNEDGTLDDSLDGDGVTGSEFFNPYDQDETYPPEITLLLPVADGMTIVGGSIDYGPYFFTFARYTSNGTLDTSFGDDGQIQTDFAGSDNLDQEPLAIAAYPGDRFVAAGYREVNDDSLEYSVIAMYDEDGELDKSFGDDGKTTSNFIPNSEDIYGDEQINAVMPMPDGRIMVAGYGERRVSEEDPGVHYIPFLALYDSDGTLSKQFGNDGSIVFDDMPGYVVHTASLTPDGKVLVTGDFNDTHQAWLARFLPDGSPDPEFGEGGWRIIDLLPGRSSVYDLAFDDDGDILAAGDRLGNPGGLSAAIYKIRSSSGTPRTFGDINCSGNADSVDALGIQRNLAALPVNQTQPCPGIGDTVDVVGASEYPWGDVDCDNDVDTVDSLKVLRFVAGLSVAQEPACPLIGASVEVTKLRRH